MLDGEFHNLQRVVAGGGTALEIDDALLPLVKHSDPSIISSILKLLNESGDQYGMWSILHTAESFDNSSYIKGLLEALPSLDETCAWWAQTLVIRSLNSETCVAELTAQLCDAPARTREAVATICKKLSEDEHFRAKVAPVLAATRL